ncbi:hypothetical protein [Myroides odoratus]|uniref:hypothetical protein n=1 Tax=Myroides odoratus TaxID=256 RepID=UPI000765E4E4|nr:hypothetical protein [Myroides odoratus]
MRKITFILGWLCCCTLVQAQNKAIRFHSHNDYDRNVPFWNAYSQGMNSIEIDLVLVDQALFVAHDVADAQLERTMERLYLEPLQQAVNMGFGYPNQLQFLVDLKGDAEASMALLLPLLKKYETIIEQYKIQFVISGNKPLLRYFLNVPAYVLIDLQVQDTWQNEVNILEKIGMISYNFQSFSTWKGRGELPAKDREQLQQKIAQAKQMKRPIRFWATPDTPEAWQTLYDLQVDYINTDTPAALRLYFENKTGK